MELYTRRLRLMSKLFVIVLVQFYLFIQVGFAQNSIQIDLENDKVSYKLNESIYLNLKMDSDDFEKIKNRSILITYYDEGNNSLRDSLLHVIKKPVSKIKIEGQQGPKILRIELSLNTENIKWSKSLGVAVDESNISTSVAKPTDFNTFWNNQIRELTNVALQQQVIHSEELSTDSYDVYYMNYVVDKSGSRFYGVLTVPKGGESEKYPAVVIYPGAGVRGYGSPDARLSKERIITLQLGVHGIPINQPAEIYSSLAKGALSDYQYFNLQSAEQYYFNRIIKGSLRALDFLQTVAQFDGENIIASGSSQGGALSLIVTSLDKRIKGTVLYCPAMCQTNGSLFNTAEGWPKPMKYANLNKDYTHYWKSVIPYYDVVNFCRDIEVPVFITFGLIDDVTPATTVFAAYNQINSPKDYYLKSNIAHANHESQRIEVFKSILRMLK